MLVLTRKVGERIRIATNIELVVTAVRGGRVKLGIKAPKAVEVARGERMTRAQPAEAGDLR